MGDALNRLHRSPLARYAVAVAATALAIVLTLALSPVMGRNPFLLLVAAVVASAWYGGLGPGLLCSALSALGSAYFLLNPVQPMATVFAVEGGRVGVFLFVALLVNAAFDMRRRAERQLQQREQEEQIIFDSVPAMIFYKDKDNRILRANKAAADSMGLRVEEVEGKSTFDLYPEEAMRYYQDDQKVIRTGQPKRGIVEPYRRPTGELRWVRTDKIPYRNDRGDIIGVVVFAVDITERVQAEEALQKTHVDLERLVQERTQSLAQANDALRAQIQERLQAEHALRRAYEELEWRVKERTADLARANLELTVEIRERERVVEALHASEARLTKAEAFSLVMVTHVGLDGRWLKVPPTLCELLGYTEEELLAGTFKNVTHPDDFDADWSQCERLIRGEIKSFDLETRSIRKDSTIIWIYLNCSVVDDEDGKPVHFIMYIRDITKRRRAEEELKQSRAQLRALAEYQQFVREEERTRIAREIHDELGQALTSLKMDLAWLAKRLPYTKRAAPLRKKAAAMADAITYTIGDVRQLSSSLRPGVLDQLGLVAAIEWQAQDFHKRSGVACRFLSPDGELAVDQARSTALFRMLQEALTNVARHADATQVTITLETHRGEVRMAVTDNGKGLSEESQSNPLALGILGMKERALALGGSVHFHGVPGKGTTVTVSLPHGEGPY